MPEVKIPDAGGATITLREFEGRLYPNFPEENLRGIPSFKIRSDDVIVCAYPKSGTHWIWEITRILLAGRTELEVIEKVEGFMELFPHDHFEKQSSPRILNTHFLFDQLPLDRSEKKCKIIFLSRNPKDVAVSLYNHFRSLSVLYEYDGTWENYLPLFMAGKVEYGSWYEYTDSWENALKSHPDLDVLTLMYEDITEDPVREIKRIAQFLKKEFSDDFYEKVCEKCSFSRMKETKGNLQIGSDGLPVFYRKGKVGDWKNWFSVSQNTEFDEVFNKWMSTSSLKIKFS